MKKLTLNVAALRVESFAPSPTQGRKDGTVFAHASDDKCYELEATVNFCPTDGNPTCDLSCNSCGSCFGTCGYSCYGTCENTCETCGQGTCFGNTCVCWP
jgi:hypothetical protein